MNLESSSEQPYFPWVSPDSYVLDLVLQGLHVHEQPSVLQCKVLQKQCRRIPPPIGMGGLLQLAAVQHREVCAGLSAAAAVPAGQRACQD